MNAELKEMLLSEAPTGRGFHDWIFKACCCLHEAGTSEAEALGLLRQAGDAYAPQGRYIPDREIKQAWDNSKPGGAGRARRGMSKLPKRSEELVARVLAEEDWGSVAAFWNTGGRIAQAAFAGSAWSTVFSVVARKNMHALICVGARFNVSEVRRMEDWRPEELEAAEFVVPSPMSDFSGFNTTNKRSSRCLDNTGPRQNIIVEFDSDSKAHQEILIYHMSKWGFPLKLCVWSGKRSIHAWFDCEGKPEVDIEAWFRRAVALGADRAMQSKHQWTRMPGGRRKQSGAGKDRELQKVIYGT